jgi:poly[(R)-3-hydroxyalkanoate] polymerase subunit PhaC
MTPRIKFDPQQAASEFAEFQRKLMRGSELLSKVKDRDVEIGATPKTLVFQTDKVTLHHYKAIAKTTIKTPVLVTYGLVGRFTMADLQEDRSLIRNLLAQGVDVYVVDWGNASRGDRWLTLDDYIDGYLNECVDFIRSTRGIDKVTLLGICEGGVFTLAYAALYPEKVRNLILTITPVDFHAGESSDRPNHGFISLWTRSMSGEDVDRLIEANGNLPGELMSFVFSMMTPLSSLTKYNVGLYDVMDEESKLLNFLRMEKWLQDRPHHPGEAAKQWLKDLYQENRLVKGTFTLSGRTVDLRKLSMPILNIYALDDHIIPPASARALKKFVSPKQYSELALPGGHVGVFVSSKSQGIVGKGVVDWLRKRS